MTLTADKKFDGKLYELKDAQTSKELAKETAEDWRNQPDPMYVDETEEAVWLARVVDGGKEAGRLRYGVYTRLEIRDKESGRVKRADPSGSAAGMTNPFRGI